MLLLLLLTAASADDLVPSTKHGGDDEPKPEDIIDDTKPPPEQAEQMKLFSGTWRCDGKANTEFAPEVPTKITLSFRPELGGRWIAVKIEEQKSKQNPRALTSSELWGYAPALGGFVRNGADTQGGFYNGTSSGWIGDRFWWTVTTSRYGKKAKWKDTFTKVNDKELTFERAVDVSGGGDAFRVIYEGTCKR
jgi:hypothetical protein